MHTQKLQSNRPLLPGEELKARGSIFNLELGPKQIGITLILFMLFVSGMVFWAKFVIVPHDNNLKAKFGHTEPQFKHIGPGQSY